MSKSSPRPEAIIFDYGGVLQYPLDLEAAWANLEAMAAEHGFGEGMQLWDHIYQSDAWERAKRGQISEDDLWAERLATLGITDEVSIVAFRERLYQHAPGVHPAMRQLLYDLRPVVRLAVLSNTAVKNMARWFEEEHGLEAVFEVVVSSADVGLAKPEPEIYHLTLERLGLPPEAALFVDDLSRNTEAAEAIGIPSIHFTTPEALREVLKVRGLL